jgi:hypothetical protein
MMKGYNNSSRVAGPRAYAVSLIIRHGLKLWIDGRESGTAKFVDPSVLLTELDMATPP